MIQNRNKIVNKIVKGYSYSISKQNEKSKPFKLTGIPYSFTNCIFNFCILIYLYEYIYMYLRLYAWYSLLSLACTFVTCTSPLSLHITSFSSLWLACPPLLRTLTQRCQIPLGPAPCFATWLPLGFLARLSPQC